MNALIRSLALAVAFGSTVAAASAKTAPPAPEPVKTAQTAPEGNASVAAPAAAPAPTHDQQAISGRQSARSADAEAIEQQLRFRVLMPPLSGDGGG